MKQIGTTLVITFFISIAFAHNHEKMLDKKSSEKVVHVEIGKKGVTPNPINIKKGENLVLKIKRTTKKTCMTALKDPKNGKLVDLPMNQEIRFEVGQYDTAKKIDLLCGMDMKAGVIHVN